MTCNWFPWTDFGLFLEPLNSQMDCFRWLNGTPVVGTESRVESRTNILIIHWILNTTISLCSLTLNLSLWVLIRSRSGQMSRMRRLLNYSCLVDILLSALNLMAGPFLNSTHGHFIGLWNGLFQTESPYIVGLFIALIGTLTIGSWGCLPLQFIYRLDVIKSGQKPRGLRLYVYLFFCLLIMGSAAFCSFNMYTHTQGWFRWNALRILHNAGLDVSINRVVGGHMSDSKMRIYTYYFTAIMLIAYSFIFYTELIRRDLIRRLAPTMAGATRRLHLDMNRTFLALAISPIITSILPSIYINYTINSCESKPIGMLILSLVITSAPFLNGSTTMTFIRPYRSAFLSWLGLESRSTKIFMRSYPLRYQQQSTISTTVDVAPMNYTPHGITYVLRI